MGKASRRSQGTVFWIGALQETYVITNNHYEGQAVVNAFELQEGLGVTKSAPPACLQEAYPRLRPR